MIPPCETIPTSQYTASYAKDSPFNHFLATNSIPNDTDIREIKDYLSGPYKRSREIQQRVHSLVAELNGLKQEHSDLETKYALKQHRSILSPLRSLPAELLQEVFVRCTPKPCIISSKEPPMRLSQVCARWRRIALSTPQLWSNLHIVVPGQHIMAAIQQLPQRQVDYGRFWFGFSEWMKRTANHPLVLSIFCRWSERRPDPPDSEAECETVITLRRMLETYAPRCQSLSLMITPVLSKALLGNFPCEHLPLLETIYIDYEVPLNAMMFANPNDHEPQAEAFPVLRNAPRLKRVSFTGHSMRYAPPDIRNDVPLHQITHLQLHSLRGLCSSSAELIIILSKCPELVYFRLWRPNSRASAIPLPRAGEPATRIVLPKLRTLEIHLHGQRADGVNLPDFFDSVSMPTLENLIIGSTPFRSQTAITDNSLIFLYITCLRDLLSQTTPPLHSLSLLMPSCCINDSIMECLDSLPQLQTLEFKGYPSKYQFYQIGDFTTGGGEYVSALLEHLTVRPPPSSVVCPKLETLTFEDRDGLSADTLKDMFRSRTVPLPVPGMNALRRVEFSTSRPAGHEVCSVASAFPNLRVDITHLKRHPDILWHHSQHTGRGLVDIMPGS